MTWGLRIPSNMKSVQRGHVKLVSVIYIANIGHSGKGKTVRTEMRLVVVRR